MSTPVATKPILIVIVLLTLMSGFIIPPAGAGMRLFRGQTVYVPLYSHIYSGDREQPFYLAATLSIRNTDRKHAITLAAVDYYDSEGKFLKHYLEKPLPLNAMATKRYVVPESDKSGGVRCQIHRHMAVGAAGGGTVDRVGDDQHQDPAGDLFYQPG